MIGRTESCDQRGMGGGSRDRNMTQRKVFHVHGG